MTYSTKEGIVLSIVVIVLASALALVLKGNSPKNKLHVDPVKDAYITQIITFEESYNQIIADFIKKIKENSRLDISYIVFGEDIPMCKLYCKAGMLGDRCIALIRDNNGATYKICDGKQ